VLCVFRFDTMEEAITRANASPFGLAAGVWSSNVFTVQAMARSLKAGTIWVRVQVTKCIWRMLADPRTGQQLRLRRSPASVWWIQRFGCVPSCECEIEVVLIRRVGYGRDGGSYALAQYTEVKTVFSSYASQ
jgi:acyl-CoA reductase-like NAD-dependent aldehyde dehydrogenase